MASQAHPRGGIEEVKVLGIERQLDLLALGESGVVSLLAHARWQDAARRGEPSSHGLCDPARRITKTA
jgi:hypothetical protein